MRNIIVIKSKLFTHFLLATISVLILINLYALLTGNFFALIPITFQTTMIFLILKKNKHLKTVLFVWSGVLLILPNALIIIAGLIYLLIDGVNAVNYPKVFKSFILLILGCVIYFFTEKNIEKKT